MDKATDYLLIQEAKISQLTNSMKIILLNARSSLLKPNKNRIKMMINKLPSKDLKDIERDAIRQIPEFKKEYLEAQRKVSKLKFHPYTTKPAALVTALVSSTTKSSVDDVLKTGHAGLRNSKLSSLVPGLAFMPLIKVGLFITFVGAIYLTDGAIILPAIKIVLKAAALLLSMLSGVLKALLAMLSLPENVTTALTANPTDDIPQMGELDFNRFVPSF